MGIFMKQKRIINILTFIFLIVGIIFLVIGTIFFIDGLTFKQNAVKVTAEIVDIEYSRGTDGDTKHSVYVTYEYGGELYEHIPLNEYRNGMYVGKQISILCNSKKPDEIRSSFILYIFPIIFIIIGMVFITICSVLFFLSIKKKNQNKLLLTEGSLLHATVNKINQNMLYSVNQQHPYVIYCSYKDEYKDIVYEFKSEHLWTNPASDFPLGSYIDVYVNKSDYRKYYVKCQETTSEKGVHFKNL